MADMYSTPNDTYQQQFEVPQAAAGQPIVINVSNVNTNTNTNVVNNGYSGLAVSTKSRTITLVLCILFGYLGAHCFYAGRFGRGLLYLFTAGLFGIGWIWDIIQIIRCKFTDRFGLPIIN